MDPLAVEVWGDGPPVVLVHGAMSDGGRSWEKQRPLAERWKLIVADRRGFGATPASGPSNFEIEADDIVALLDGGAHLVGHSYGAIVAMFATARLPGAVRSLTVIEPPAHSLARGQPDVEAQIAHFHEHRIPGIDPHDFYRAFLERLGAPTERIADGLSDEAERDLRMLMTERPPWEVRIPVETLRAASVPVLVVTGGHQPMFEMLADLLVAELGGCAERAVIPGRGHVVQRIGAPFNDRLEAFLTAASRDIVA